MLTFMFAFVAALVAFASKSSSACFGPAIGYCVAARGSATGAVLEVLRIWQCLSALYFDEFQFCSIDLRLLLTFYLMVVLWARLQLSGGLLNWRYLRFLTARRPCHRWLSCLCMIVVLSFCAGIRALLGFAVHMCCHAYLVFACCVIARVVNNVLRHCSRCAATWAIAVATHSRHCVCVKNAPEP